jgi:alkaline phosphatase
MATGLALAQMPKNVILMVGDGQGYNTVAATALFRGEASIYESFQVQYGVSTFPANGSYNPKKAWKSFDYVKSGTTDSAAAATAMASGVKTYNGAIGVDTERHILSNLVEVASSEGKATGVVSSVPFSHATPAAMAAHNASRNNYEAIAKDMLASGLDVIMGAGHPEFDNNGNAINGSKDYKYVGGQDTWEALKNGQVNGWKLIETKTAFEELANGGPAPANKVVGVAQVHNTLQQRRSEDGTEAPFGAPLNDHVPSLEVMTKGALNLLSRDPDGFFLMVEGGAVDWANHANQLGRMIEEEMDFNAAVAAVVGWVEANGGWEEALVIITADHETGYLWGPGSGPPKSLKPLIDQGAGSLPGAEFYSGEHTNSLVPLYAKGAGAELFAGYADQIDPKRGPYIDNTEVFPVMLGKAAEKKPKRGKGRDKSTYQKAVGF